MDAITLMENVAYAAIHAGREISIEMKDVKQNSKGAFGMSDTNLTNNSIILTVHPKIEEPQGIEYDADETEED